MKIIIRSPKVGTKCYVQIKDLIYLNNTGIQAFGNIIRNNTEINDYNSFIQIKDPSLINFIEQETAIIDYYEYRDYSIESLSRIISNKNFGLLGANDEYKRMIDYQSDTLRDLIALKTKTLEYRIPLITDGVFYRSRGNNIISSTTFGNVLVAFNNKDDNEESFKQFIEETIKEYITEVMHLNIEDVEYKIEYKNNKAYICIIKKSKKISFKERIAKLIKK